MSTPKEIEELREKRTKLEEESNSLEKEQANLEEQVKKLEEKMIEGLSDKNNAVRGTISGLQSKVNELQQKLGQFQHQTATAEKVPVAPLEDTSSQTIEEQVTADQKAPETTDEEVVIVTELEDPVTTRHGSSNQNARTQDEKRKRKFF